MPRVVALPTSRLSAGLLRGIRDLLDDAFDGDFSAEDWDHALGGWHVVVTDAGRPLAHAAVVPRAIDVGDRTLRAGYVEAVATAPAAQGAGHGSRVMAEVARRIRHEYEVGVLATGRQSFYERLGWERWHGPSFVADGQRRVRTSEDDDALMVLRFGTSSQVPLDAPITCRARPGDPW